MRKPLAFAMVLALSLGLNFLVPASVAASAPDIIKAMPQNGKLITSDGQELIPVEVAHAVSLEKEIASLSSFRIAEFTDLAHFEEKANSPLRPQTLAILGVENWNWTSYPRTFQGALKIKVVKYSPATVEPKVWNTSFPISGFLEPNYLYAYGPYSGYLYLTISINWSPSNPVLDVGFKYLDSPNFYYSRLSNGSGTAGFSLDPSRSFQVMIYNPSPPNNQTINYSGTVTLFFQ
ncbi:MAG: hypothetical protein ACPL7L_03595 [bacterium]